MKDARRTFDAFRRCREHEKPDDCVGCPYRSSEACMYELDADMLAAIEAVLDENDRLKAGTAKPQRKGRNTPPKKGKKNIAKSDEAPVLAGQLCFA